MQADIYPSLGLWRRVDRPILCIEGPPALWVAKDHPALDRVQPRVINCLLSGLEDDRLTSDTENNWGRYPARSCRNELVYLT
jgi:hypothetical protein